MSNILMSNHYIWSFDVLASMYIMGSILCEFKRLEDKTIAVEYSETCL